jgi:hypothetical protein
MVPFVLPHPPRKKFLGAAPHPVSDHLLPNAEKESPQGEGFDVPCVLENIRDRICWCRWPARAIDFGDTGKFLSINSSFRWRLRIGA